MRGSKKEREANRAAFHNMNTKEKLAYIFEYYKLPLFTLTVAVVVLIASVVHEVTKKDPILYLAYVNTAVGETLDAQLTDGFLAYTENNPKKTMVTVYRDLYISDDASVENHEFAYASKMKIVGAISARKMDVVLMNREAYDLMSESGFLLDLTTLEDEALIRQMEPYLVSNEVIIDDNAIEYRLNEAEEYVYESADFENSIEVTGLSFFQEAGMSGEVYAGIIANTKHPKGSAAFLSYLLNS